MVRNKWQNSIKDCQAYSSFFSIGSDHRIVSASVKLSFKVSKKTTADPKKSIYWKSVQNDKNLSTQYTVGVFNRFQELNQSFTEAPLEPTNIDVIVALSTLPKKHKSQRKPASLDSKVVGARGKLRQASLAYHCNPSMHKKKEIEEAKKSLDLVYIEVEEPYIKGEIASISHLHLNQQHSAAWKTINQLAGKGSQAPPSVKGGSREQRHANWHSHFKHLLGSPASLPENVSLPKVRVSQTLNISTEPVTSAELKYVFKKPMKNTLGPDKIPALLRKDNVFS